MQGQNQSYLDLSVLKELRKHVLSQDAVVLFNQTIDKILWANAAGAQLFGGRGVVDLLSATLSDNQSIVRQLKDSIDQMEHTKTITRGFRINQGLRSLLIQFEIKRILLGDDEVGYKVTNFFEGSKLASENTLADHAVETLNGFADAAAILDDYGLPLSVSKDFQDLGPSEEVLSSLIDELRDEKDRLIKRPKANLQGNIIAIGLARLSDKPGRNLIVLADTNTQAQNDLDTVEDETPLPVLDEAASETHEEVKIEETIIEDTSPKLEADTVVEKIAPLSQSTPSQDNKYETSKDDGTVRFAWMIDADRIFQSVSPELANTVGENAASVVGREWREVANVFGFDTNREIETLLNKQDTWSGKTVLWPVQGTDMVLPIDLAALPSFNAEREFEGFRGFGIIRSADALLDPDETGLALASLEAIQEPTPETEPEPEIEAQNEVKSEPTSTSNTSSNTISNIVRLVPRTTQPVVPTLSEQESYAFRKIGDTLRKKDGSPNTEKTFEQEIDTRLETEPDYNSEITQVDEETPSFKPAGLDTSIMQELPVAIVIYNSDEILFTNKSLLEASGYETTAELQEAGGIEAILTAMQDGSEEPTPNYCLTTKSGEQTPIRPVLHTVPWAGEKALLISFATTPETPQQEPPALEISSVSEIQNILDITSDGILVLDANGDIVSINASAEALFNISFDGAKGQNITSLFAAESRNNIRQYVESLFETSLENLFNDGQEVIAAEANGGMIPVFITISKMQSSGKLCAVIRDMTNWKKAEEELIQSRHEAESASSQKTDFLAHISHEIRTPLNSIIGFSDIMIEERFGPIQNERYREYLRDINRSGNHVLDLINDLLDLSKIEAGKLELEFEAVDLNDLVSETVALLQPQANSSRIIIRTSLSRSVPKVVADVRSIRQIILNLVSNAIKFSPTNSQVIVSTVYESNGEVALRIRDTGNGMNKEQIDDALKPFHQIHNINEQRNEGSGLGLPLTKALIEANRALFDLESEPGQGTIAHVQFPTQRVLAD